MQILFTGAQGTGKTSVLDALSSPYQKIQGVTRKCIIENKLSFNQDSTDHSQRAIFNAYVDALDINEDFISERSLFDVYAFTSYQYLNKKCSKSELLYQGARLEEYIDEHPDAVYVYFPVEFAPQPDGTRSTDQKYQKEIDSLLYCTLIMSEVKFIVVHGSVEERVKQVQDLIKEQEKK